MDELMDGYRGVQTPPNRDELWQRFVLADMGNPNGLWPSSMWREMDYARVLRQHFNALFPAPGKDGDE